MIRSPHPLVAALRVLPVSIGMAIAITIAIAIANTAPVRADSVSAGEPSARKADLARLQAHTSFLADDRLRGRDTGSSEFGIAALYAATRFAEFGLEPGAGANFYQPVAFVESRVEKPSIRISTVSAIAATGGKRATAELDPLADYVMSGSVTAVRSKLSAPVVYVGYGIQAPELDVDDYAGVDVRGKVVLFLSGAPATFPNDQRAHHSSRRLKAELAEAHGAVAALYVRDRTDEQRVPWERIIGYADRPRTAWKASSGDIQDAFPALLLAAALSRPGAEKLLSAGGLTLDRLLDEAESGKTRSRALPVRVDASCDNRISTIESPNVVGKLPGSDPSLAGEYVVVSAHLDHIGVGEAVDGDSIRNGFYDNAMGSSILLEAARVLADSPAAERPRRSVLFLLVTGEERGLLGSDYFATHPTVGRSSIVANVNVDMPLLLTPTADLIAFGGDHSSLGALAEHAATESGFILAPDPMPEEVIFVRSDQYSFVRHGVPAINLSPGLTSVDGSDTQQKAFGAFLANNYHRPSDEIALGADWASVKRFTDMEVQLIRLIADADSRPQWNKGDFFGDLFGGKGAN